MEYRSLSLSKMVKLSPSNSNNLQHAKASPSAVVVPIPLERPETPEFNKSEGQTYKLRHVPTDADSPGYDVSIRYFGSGSCEEFLTFETDLKRIFTGQNLNSGPQRFTITRRLLKGGALTSFNQALPAGTSETIESWENCMNAVRESVFPPFANITQRKTMRNGKMRKPANWTIQQYVDRMREINGYLKRFPRIAPNRPAKDMEEDELVEAIALSVPNSWNNQMIVQGFKPHEHTLAEYLEKCQCFEVAESREPKNNGKNNHDGDTKNKKGKGKREHNQTKSGKKVRFAKGPEFNEEGLRLCPLHGGHPMQDCKVIMDQAKSMKGMWDAQDPLERRKKQREQKAFREINTVDGINKLVQKKVEEELARRKSNKRQKKELNTFQNLSLSSSESEDERSLIDVPSSDEE